MRKKLLNGKMMGILAVLLALFMAVGAAGAERTDASGQWRYVLEDGGATITGCVVNPKGDLLIPDELDGYMVMGIGERAYVACRGLTSVTIPDSVTTIGAEAFVGCDAITSVTIPDSVNRIDSGAFLGCKSLASVTIPASVTSIGTNIFGSCPLARIDVAPDNPVFESIDGVLFNKEQKMLIAYPNGKKGKYSIPKGTLGIGDSAFYWCENLTSVIIPKSVKSIGDRAFILCEGLTSVTISEGVTSIGDSAFSSCYALTSVKIPKSVTSIGNNAFRECESLTSVTIPASVTSIGTNPFRSCPRARIEVASKNPIFESIDGVLFDKEQKLLISYPCARKGAFMIPEGTLRVGNYAFAWSIHLSGVTIPDSMTSIGDGAFYQCGSLRNVTIPESVTFVGEEAFSRCEKLNMSVTAGSYAEQYAKENGIPYEYIVE